MRRLGERLREARESQGFSVRELGRVAGVSYATISAVENGHRTEISVSTILRLARALNTSVDYLLGTFERDEDRQAAVLATI
jgi:XRE family transcriptional regulator, master regulator for biofilm formation